MCIHYNQAHHHHATLAPRIQLSVGHLFAVAQRQLKLLAVNSCHFFGMSQKGASGYGGFAELYNIPSTYLYKYKFYAYGVIIKIIFFLYFIFIYLLAPIIYHALPPKQEPQTQTTIVWQLPRFI